MEPGAVASAVAREAGIHASQLYRWRQELCGPARAAPGFAAVTIATEPGAAANPDCDIRRTDRDRVGERSAAADQRRCGCCDGFGGDRGADGQAAMTIPLPSGARVWLATGHTDMRNYAECMIMLKSAAGNARSVRLGDDFHSA